MARRLFIAVPLLWVAAAHVYPLLAMLRVSLLDRYPAAPGTPPAFDLHAYAAFLADAGTRFALLHTMLLALVTTLLALLLCWPLAWHVAIHVPRTRRLRRLALLAAPFWTSEVLRMFALVLLLARHGALNAALAWAGIAAAPLPLLYGTGSVVLGLLYSVLLTTLLPLYAMFDRLPRDLLDAAADLGAGCWQRQRRIVLPLAADGVATAVALTFLLCLGALVAPALLGGAGIPAFAVLIADAFAAASGDWPTGAAFAMVLLAAGTAASIALGSTARALARRAG